ITPVRIQPMRVVPGLISMEEIVGCGWWVVRSGGRRGSRSSVFSQRLCCRASCRKGAGNEHGGLVAFVRANSFDSFDTHTIFVVSLMLVVSPGDSFAGARKTNQS